MIKSIEQYLSELKKELSHSDRAVIQDALSDAEEYLRTALNNAREVNAAIAEADALAPIIEKYGTPAEVAAAYKEIESRTPPAFAPPVRKENEPTVVPVSTASVAVAPAALAEKRSFIARFFGIYADPRAWGALLYLIFALGTGIIYFTWAVTGMSTSAGLLVIIIGVPFLALFLLSVRGIALVEGRLVEALLGVRMPRRTMFSRKDVSLWQKIKALFAERHTWTAIIYMLLQMPLGIIYFTVFFTLIFASFWLVVWPIVAASQGLPVFVILPYEYYVPGWLIPVWIIGAGLLLTATMHLVKQTGRLHGNYAKVMLVKE
jgi:hypothetical protein